MMKFEEAIQKIDEANSADPKGEAVLYSKRMTERLARFAPEASEALKLAARAQHICRWEVPRDSYPMDKKGYYAWRTGLYQFHAQKAGEILRQLGYDDLTIQKTGDLLSKKNLKIDPEMQTLEDVICLVFLEHYLEDFAKEHSEDKLIDIIQKTWKKMSAHGHAAALALPYAPEIKALIGKALN